MNTMVTKAPYTSSSPTPSISTSTNSSLGNLTVLSSLVPPSWTLPKDPFWQTVYLTMQIAGSLEAVLILSANLLLLLVILSSPLLRSGMRNRLVINVLVSNLLVGLLGAPFTVDYTVRRRWVHGCFVTVMLVVLCSFVQNFITMWGVVALQLHYLARLLRYEGPQWLARLPPWLQMILPSLLIASPWVLSVILQIPVIFGGLDKDTLAVWSYNTCPFVLENWARYVLNAFSFIIPALTLILLVILIIIFRQRQEDRVDVPSKMETGQAVMSCAIQDLEGCWVHVLVAVLAVVMMGPEHLLLVVRRGPWRHIVIASLIVHLLSDLLPCLLPLLWLLMLPDVRGRVRELVDKLPGYFVCCRTRSPPQASGSTSVAPVAFKDLNDE